MNKAMIQRNCPKLMKLGYKRYQIVTGPASGTVIEAAVNPQALPCFRWRAVSGPGAFKGFYDGFTLRGLARAIDAELSGTGRSITAR